jgi:hypothetical protein
LAVSDDYLWNRQGRDREVEALERLLAPLAHGQRAAVKAQPRTRAKWIPALALLAAAAAIVLAVRAMLPAANPRSATEPLTAAREIDLRQFGTVKVHEGALVEVVRQTDEDIRLRLTRGTIDARITLAARPRLFQVETPATTCVDLGCHYTMTVEPDGSTFVHVDLGEVAFVENGRETWIPRDASCRAWPARGSGTPRWDDASEELIAAIEILDRSPASARAQRAETVISLCTRKRDSLSLWHLTQASDPRIADAARARLIDMTGLPEGLTDPGTTDQAARWKRHLESIWASGG